MHTCQSLAASACSPGPGTRPRSQAPVRAASEATGIEQSHGPCAETTEYRLTSSGANHVFLAKRASVPPDCSRELIAVAASKDGGRTFGEFIDTAALLPTSDFITDVAVASDADTGVVIAWLDHQSRNDRRGNIGRVFVTRSTDTGKTFQEPIRVDDPGKTAVHDSFSGLTMVRQGSRDLLLSGTDKRRGPEEDIRDLWCARSSDGGASFSSETLVGPPADASTPKYLPLVAANARGEVLAVWKQPKQQDRTEWSFHGAVSVDGGRSFRSLGPLLADSEDVATLKLRQHPRGGQ
ncbi:MAG: exo-alpha-sialidase [Candidatus Schekmanbacteria bacterium]|nr:exo-alpha-sialidase [Candidatus Schekmanbacteria bacterium]